MCGRATCPESGRRGCKHCAASALVIAGEELLVQQGADGVLDVDIGLIDNLIGH